MCKEECNRVFVKLREYLNGEYALSKLDIEEINNCILEISLYIEKGLEKPVELINEMMLALGDMYLFKGQVYRGIFIEEEEIFKVKVNELCSFSSNVSTAENFALKDDGFGIVLKQNLDFGFNYSELLYDLVDRGILSIDDVEVYIDEDTIFGYINERCSVYKSFDTQKR